MKLGVQRFKLFHYWNKGRFSIRLILKLPVKQKVKRSPIQTKEIDAMAGAPSWS